MYIRIYKPRPDIIIRRNKLQLLSTSAHILMKKHSNEKHFDSNFFDHFYSMSTLLHFQPNDGCRYSN